jgi:hypothetical protein
MGAIDKDQLMILEEYCRFINAQLEQRTLSEGNLRGLLTEAFTSKSFATLLSQLSQLEGMVPDEMEYTLHAIARAVKQSEKSYALLIRRKITKEEFAKTVAQTKGLVNALSDTFQELQTLLLSRRVKMQLRSRLAALDDDTVDSDAFDDDGHDRVAEILDDVLDASQKDVIRARIERAFEQPTDLLGRFWKSISPGSYGWYGLTEKRLFADVMSLTRSGLQALGHIDGDAIEELFPSDIEETAEDILSSQDEEFEEVNFDLPEDENRTDEMPPTAPEDAPSPKLKPKVKPAEAEQPSENAILSVKELLAKYGDGEELDADMRKALIGALRKSGVRIRENDDFSREDKVILERWRRMAGIRGSGQ